MLKIVKQQHTTLALNSHNITIINGQMAPQQLTTGCYFVQKEEVDNENEIIDLFCKHEFINIPKTSLQNIQMGVDQNTGCKVIIISFIFNLQNNRVDANATERAQLWPNQLNPNTYELHKYICHYTYNA
jgi:hypothetical protein